MIAPSTNSGTSQPESEKALWECFNSGLSVDIEDETKDLIGVLDPQGFEIRAIPKEQTLTALSRGHTDTTEYEFQVEEKDLGENDIHQWIKNGSIKGEVDATLKLKVLLIDQVVIMDRLRPPSDALAVRFSRNVLCTNTGCPFVALEKLSRNESWMCDFPRDERDSTRIDCKGFGARSFGAMWMSKSGSDTIWAIVRLYGGRSGMRKDIIRDLYNLRVFAEHPSFLPFITLNAAIDREDTMMDRKMAVISRTGLKLERFPDARTAGEVYGTLLASSRTFAVIQRDTRNMQRMAEKLLHLAAPRNVRHDLRLQRTCSSMKRAFTYQKQVLRDIFENAEEFQSHTSMQLQCVLGMMARRQQDLSIEIAQGQARLAEASRREQILSVEIARTSQSIAEETKKDGASMKTLAVVTLVYLPCTTVSSVLAMPLFDWDADGGAIVNPRIWVFFVFAVPLTVMTIGLWRLWLRCRKEGKLKVADSSSTSSGS